MDKSPQSIIGTYKKNIAELKEEIVALRQLLDCAAANIVILTEQKGGKVTLSKERVCEALGKYRLCATRDNKGNYILEISEE